MIETGDGDDYGDGDGGIPASPEQLIPFVKECHQGSLCPARSWNINKIIIIITNININIILLPDFSIINSHLEEGKTISLKERLQEFETALLGNHHYKKRYLNKSDQKKKSWPKRNLVIIYPTTVQTSACCRLFHN